MSPFLPTVTKLVKLEKITKISQHLCQNEKLCTYLPYLQGVPFENWIFQMAVALKRCIFDPMLVKPKCV